MRKKTDTANGAGETIPDRPNAPHLTPEDIQRQSAQRSGQKPTSDPDEALTEKRGEG